MFNLLSTLFGGAFTLAAAFGLGAIVLRGVAAPPEILLAAGAAAESLLVFILLSCHAGSWPVFLAVGTGAIVALKWIRPAHGMDPPREALSARGRAAAGLVFAAYGVYYLASALAPEIQPDGITYHLGLPYEYVRMGGFPDHVRFYDLVPQGLEMLFTVAFALGRGPAAKLVELGFFAAGLPLIFRIGRRLGMSDTASLLAGVFYWSAPVIGLTGSSSYNDAALVFFALAAFYLLLVWRDSGQAKYLAPAGALGGFCYALKFPGLFAGVAAVLFVLAAGKGRVRHVALLGAGMALTAAPWMIRSAVLTGNPVAPLADRVFPNPYFHPSTERELAAGMRSLHGVAPARVPWELALGDGLNGTFGPLLFALPAGVLAWRRRRGRICLAAAMILAIPWWSNTGARFLMPAVMFAAFALAMVLPLRAAWAAIAVQALVCWPPLLNAWQPSYTFRLHELPWQAALGLESQDHYLKNHIPEYNVARMVEHFTPAGASTFSLLPVATAYAARDVSVSWQSAEGDRLTDTLRRAARARENPLYAWTGSWPPASLRALRFRLNGALAGEWDIAEVQLMSDGDRIFNSPLWSLRAWPNVWEAPLAFDNRRSTVWRQWQAAPKGTFLEVDLDHAQTLSAAVVLSHAPGADVPLEFYGQGPDGKWRLLSNRPSSEPRQPEDLRMEAASLVRRAGYRYLLAPLDDGGNGPLGRQLMAQSAEWGLEVAAVAGPNVLFQLR